MKEEKRKQLEARRERLQQLLLEEQDLLARELEELRLSMNLREKKIREQHRNLKSAREEQRKLVHSCCPSGPPRPVSGAHVGHPWVHWSDELAANSRASRGKCLLLGAFKNCFNLFIFKER